MAAQVKPCDAVDHHKPAMHGKWNDFSGESPQTYLTLQIQIEPFRNLQSNIQKWLGEICYMQICPTLRV